MLLGPNRPVRVTPRGPHSRTLRLSWHRGLRFIHPGMALCGQEPVCDDIQPRGDPASGSGDFGPVTEPVCRHSFVWGLG